jgi:adenylosuccinate synthase
MEKTAGSQDFKKLPEKAKIYIQYLSDLLKTPFLIISTGPDREETIEMGTLFVDS